MKKQNLINEIERQLKIAKKFKAEHKDLNKDINTVKAYHLGRYDALLDILLRIKQQRY